MKRFPCSGLLDRDATLWCGYLIGTPFGNIYFAGDSGYNEEMFREIGSRCDKIKVSLLPIGAYKPGWFMSPIHISPEEAVKIHRNLRSDISIAMHFGTFPLADDGYDDPIRDLRKALTDFQIDQGAFIALKEGDHLVVD